jgi:hypothetical protein
VLLAALLLALQAPPPPPATVRGRVLERGTRAPIPLANVRAGDAAAEADEDGRFTLTVPPGEVTLSVAAAGHVSQHARERVAAGEIRSVTYYLERTDAAPSYETVVRGQPVHDEMSVEHVTAQEIASLPGSLGDTLRAVQNLPGLARAPLASGLFIVRGGRPTDSRVYVEGAEAPQLYHFGALTSVVAPDLVGGVDFLPGNFSVRYGRAIAGTIDMTFREPRTDRLHGEVDANIFDTGVVVEGPAAGGGFAVAARRSYIDAILPAVLPSSAGVDFTTAPRYYDYQALYDRALGPGHLSLRAYGSDDDLGFLLAQPRGAILRGQFDTHIYFHRAQAEWSGLIAGTRVTAMESIGLARVSAHIGEGLDFDERDLSAQTRLEATRVLARRARATVGLDAQLTDTRVSAALPPPPREGQVMLPIDTQPIKSTRTSGDASTLGLYAAIDLDITPRVVLTPGLRSDWYARPGASTLDPRANLVWRASQTLTVRAGAGLYSQIPQAQDIDPVFGNPDIGPEHALQLAAGVARRFGGGLALEGTLFGKYLFDLSTPTTAVNRASVPENVANTGTGFVVGGELLARQSLAGFGYGWLSYTLMRSERRDRPGAPLRLFDFDQTHVLTVALHKNLPRGWAIGLRFRYVTGNPYTPARGGYYVSDADSYVPYLAPVNSARLPAFHQLDLRVDKTFTFERFLLAVYLDLENVYDRANAESVRYAYDYQSHTYVTGLPILPAFGIRGTF